MKSRVQVELERYEGVRRRFPALFECCEWLVQQGRFDCARRLIEEVVDVQPQEARLVQAAAQDAAVCGKTGSHVVTSAMLGEPIFNP